MSESHGRSTTAEVDTPTASTDQLFEFAGSIALKEFPRLHGKAGITWGDFDDVQQQVLLRLAQRLPLKVRDGNWRAAVWQIVKQSFATEVRNRLAKKRNPYSVQSLNERVGPGGEVELGDLIGQARDRHETQSRDPFDIVDLGLDVEEFMKELSTDQRQLCEALQLDSVSELSRLLQRPRSTVNDEIRKLRRVFEDRRLQDYLL